MQTTSSFPVEMSSKSGERDKADFSGWDQDLAHEES